MGQRGERENATLALIHGRASGSGVGSEELVNIGSGEAKVSGSEVLEAPLCVRM